MRQPSVVRTLTASSLQSLDLFAGPSLCKGSQLSGALKMLSVHPASLSCILTCLPLDLSRIAGWGHLLCWLSWTLRCQWCSWNVTVGASEPAQQGSGWFCLECDGSWAFQALFPEIVSSLIADLIILGLNTLEIREESQCTSQTAKFISAYVSLSSTLTFYYDTMRGV